MSASRVLRFGRGTTLTPALSRQREREKWGSSRAIEALHASFLAWFSLPLAGEG
jgi:hypothetical protein